jgi:hypothetical protein
MTPLSESVDLRRLKEILTAVGGRNRSICVRYFLEHVAQLGELPGMRRLAKVNFCFDCVKNLDCGAWQDGSAILKT